MRQNIYCLLFAVLFPFFDALRNKFPIKSDFSLDSEILLDFLHLSRTVLESRKTKLYKNMLRNIEGDIETVTHKHEQRS